MQSGGIGSCAACGADSIVDARYCNRCGAKLAATAATGPAAADAERKQVTVLFSDLTGYRALSEQLVLGQLSSESHS